MIASVVEMLASHVQDGDNADGLSSLLAEAGEPGKQAESSGATSSRFEAPMSLQASAATAAQHLSAEITLSGCKDGRKGDTVVGQLPLTHAGWEGASMGCDIRYIPGLEGTKSIVFVPTVAPGSLIRARVRTWQSQHATGLGPQPARGAEAELATPDGPVKWGDWARIPLPEGSFAALYRIGERGLLDRAGAPADVDRLLLQSESAFSCAHEAQRQLTSVMALSGSSLSPCSSGAS